MMYRYVWEEEQIGKEGGRRGQAARSCAALLRHLADSLRGMSPPPPPSPSAIDTKCPHFAGGGGFSVLFVEYDQPKPPPPAESASIVPLALGDTAKNAVRQKAPGRGWGPLPRSVPADAGVFQGLVDVDGVRCVHPLQVYLDLAGHPERAAEAADELRGCGVIWGNDG